MLSLKQLEDVCLVGAGWQNVPVYKQCIYLNASWPNSYCLKKNLVSKKNIEAQVLSHLKDCKKMGIDPKDANVPLGDNCDGYPKLKHIEQGYDKD